MDQQVLTLIAKEVDSELEKEGFDPHQRIAIWESLVKLVLIMDVNRAPIHNPLFVAGLRSLARALELINSLRGHT